MFVAGNKPVKLGVADKPEAAYDSLVKGNYDDELIPKMFWRTQTLKLSARGRPLGWILSENLRSRVVLSRDHLLVPERPEGSESHDGFEADTLLSGGRGLRQPDQGGRTPAGGTTGAEPTDEALRDRLPGQAPHPHAARREGNRRR
jgi:hypothetical protein